MRVSPSMAAASLLLAGLLLAGPLTVLPGTAQTPSAQPASRITSAVDGRVRVALKGTIPGAVRPEFDQGAAEQSTQLSHIRLMLSRTPEQDAALTTLMTQQLDKSSPNYHKWLTPEQFGKLYGPSDADIAAITNWLQSVGLTVNFVPKSRILIDVSGSVAEVESAFNVSIHKFNRNGHSFLANVNEAQIPAALAPVVSTIAHLNTIMPRPLSVPGAQGKIDSATHKIVLAPASGSPPVPALTSGGYLFITPSDAATIYDTPNKYNANYTTSSGPVYDGTGVNIGIGGTNLVDPAFTIAYRQLFLGDSKAPIVVNDFGATEAADGEADLDLQLSGGLAPGANIYYYPSPDLFSGVEQAAEDNKVDVFSLSYASCEGWDPTADNVFFSQLWQQFAAQGITVNVASGDWGSSGCDDTGGLASDGIKVNGLASTPYDVAIGGTDFIGLVTNGFSTYVSSNNNTYYGSALGYIPESAMNDTTWPNETIAQNSEIELLNYGSGGGPSNCAYNTTDSSGNIVCKAGFPKPFWQHAPGVPNDGVRDTPDVSLMMGNGLYGAFWATCNDGAPCYNGYVNAIGGTSASSPAFAGIWAQVIQKTGGRLGQAAVTLYRLARNLRTQNVFHDVTVGNNAMLCVEGSPNCALNPNGYYYITGFNAGPGYDLTTGLGSVDATKLIHAWRDADTGSQQATVTVKPLETTAASNRSLPVVVTVKASSGHQPPFGTLTLTIPFYGSQPIGLIPVGWNESAALLIVPASALQSFIANNGAGQAEIIVTYSGDGEFSSATGTASITINAPAQSTAASLGPAR